MSCRTGRLRGERPLRGGYTFLLRYSWLGLRLLGLDCAGVDGHSGYGVYAQGVEGFDFALLPDASGYDELLCGAGSENGGDVDGEALHGAFSVDVGVEECGAVVFEPGDGFLGGEVDGFFPTFDGDFAGFGVD